MRVGMRLTGQTLAATDAIVQLLCERVEPLYCLDCLRKSLEACLDRPAPPPADAASRCLQLGLRGCAILFERLPGEVLPEELPRTRSLVLKVHSTRLKRR